MLLEKYSSTWINDFQVLKAEIDTALTGVQYRIEHVGSTSVPNLDAKPIIDIDIIYSEQSEFDRIKSGLERAGYYHNGNQGIEDREVFKRKWTLGNGALDTISHHLYVCPDGSKALERHILSRDFLRNHEWARIKYQQMKYELADKCNQDRKEYARLKEIYTNDFIDFMISQNE